MQAVRAVSCAVVIVCAVGMLPFEILGKEFAVFLSGREPDKNATANSACNCTRCCVACCDCVCVCVACFLLKYWDRDLQCFFIRAPAKRANSACSALHALFAVAITCAVCFLLKYWEKGLWCFFLSGRWPGVRAVRAVSCAVVIVCVGIMFSFEILGKMFAVFLSGRGSSVRTVRAIVCVVCFLLKYWERDLRCFYQGAGQACEQRA